MRFPQLQHAEGLFTGITPRV